jgi:P27 family predicted phage terminase small subunit
MSRRGPAPTPTKIKAARGSWRAKINRREPAPEPGAPPRPQWLAVEARAYWDELVPELLRLGVLSLIDAKALARYCQTWARWRKADEWIQQHGLTYPIKDKDGNVAAVQQWPEVGIFNKLSAQLLRLEQEFGLTPAARTRVQAQVPTQRVPPAATDHPILRIAR